MSQCRNFLHALLGAFQTHLMEMGLRLDSPSFCLTYETLIHNQLQLCPVAHFWPIMTCSEIYKHDKLHRTPSQPKSHSAGMFAGWRHQYRVAKDSVFQPIWSGLEHWRIKTTLKTGLSMTVCMGKINTSERAISRSYSLRSSIYEASIFTL